MLRVFAASTGSAFLAAGGQGESFSTLTGVLAIIGSVGGIAAAITAFVAVYRMRSDRSMTDSQRRLNDLSSMQILFEKQREVNVADLALREEHIAELERKLGDANGDRDRVKQELVRCQRERSVLARQIQGLNATITELARRKPA